MTLTEGVELRLSGKPKIVGPWRKPSAKIAYALFYIGPNEYHREMIDLFTTLRQSQLDDQGLGLFRAAFSYQQAIATVAQYRNGEPVWVPRDDPRMGLLITVTHQYEEPNWRDLMELLRQQMSLVLPNVVILKITGGENEKTDTFTQEPDDRILEG